MNTGSLMAEHGKKMGPPYKAVRTIQLETLTNG